MLINKLGWGSMPKRRTLQKIVCAATSLWCAAAIIIAKLPHPICAHAGDLFDLPAARAASGSLAGTFVLSIRVGPSEG